VQQQQQQQQASSSLPKLSEMYATQSSHMRRVLLLQLWLKIQQLQHQRHQQLLFYCSRCSETSSCLKVCAKATHNIMLANLACCLHLLLLQDVHALQQHAASYL
jgi:hypothetical protein